MDPAAVMRRWWEEVWGESNFDLIPELVCDRYVRHSASGTVERDHAGLCEDMARYCEVLHRPVVSVDDLAVVDDKVWSRVTMDGVNLQTGEPRVVTWLQINRFVEGRIAESWMLYANDIDWR